MVPAGAGPNDSRSYMLEKPGKELYDDVAWYEGRYPSQINAAVSTADGPRGGRGSAIARLDARRAVAAASETGEHHTPGPCCRCMSLRYQRVGGSEVVCATSYM